MSLRRRVLIVEDDTHIAAIVALHLRDLECDVHVTADGRDAVERLYHTAFDLVVLDIMLPGIDGFALCQHIRRGPGYIPILMLTARSEELDRLLGLELGADDYMTKPFSVRELVARVKALFRRAQALVGPILPSADVIRAGDVLIDRDGHSASVAGRALALTGKELQLLALLAAHPGRVYTRAELMQQVWGFAHDADAHTVNSHINRLRAKIEADPSSPRYIRTVRGVGYKLADPHHPEAD